MSFRQKVAERVRFAVLGGLFLGLFVALSGCEQPPSVVLYTSVDQQFAQHILQLFEQRTGIHVETAFDTEAGKTTGHLRRLQREKARPRCDVWWSSEVFATIELARGGVLEAYVSPGAADIPVAWKDRQGRWTALAARARVLAFNTKRVSKSDLPTTWRDLADPKWAARLAVANPQFGTTRGHLAAMFAYWGNDAGRAFLQTLRDANAALVDGNSQAVRLVAGGRADICMTDTDDVWVAQRRNEPIDLVYPRLAADAPVVWIPCSVARVRGGPNPEAARRLIDFLVSAEVERALAESDSRNVPVRAALRKELELTGPAPQAIDFERVADALPVAMRAARDILLR